MHERTLIGLDVHARSIQAGVLDGLTGEVKSLAVPVATGALVAWVCAQPGPQAVAYEAVPTGYELARAPPPPACPASWLRPRASRAPPAIASRPTAATPSGWRGCCASRNWLRCASRALPRRRPATWCVPARTPAAT